MVIVQGVQCLRCGYLWMVHKDKPEPKRCVNPKCRSSRWNRVIVAPEAPAEQPSLKKSVKSRTQVEPPDKAHDPPTRHERSVMADCIQRLGLCPGIDQKEKFLRGKQYLDVKHLNSILSVDGFVTKRKLMTPQEVDVLMRWSDYLDYADPIS